MPATGKLVIQYPPGVGLVLALLPPGHQVIAMYMLATIAVFSFALFAIFRARNTTSTLIAGAFGCLPVYLMINPVTAELFDSTYGGRVLARGLSHRAMAR